MTGIPTLEMPPGDPLSVRRAAQRLEQTAVATTETAKHLGTANSEVGRVWESGAQRMFSTLAGGWAEIAASAASIMSRYAEAMSRYATVLEASQSTVRHAQQRLQMLAASTPTGAPLDQAAVSAILTQARQASESAARAATELTSTASALIGPVRSGAGSPGSARDGHRSLVSRSHVASAGLATSAAARSFDGLAGGLERQIAGAINGVIGLASRPTGVSGGQIVFSPQNRTRGEITFTDVERGGSDPRFLVNVPLTLSSSSSPILAAMRAVEGKHERFLRQMWRRLFPDEEPPEGNALALRRAMIERGHQLGPTDFAAVTDMGVGTINNSRTHALREGFRLVRRDGWVA